MNITKACTRCGKPMAVRSNSETGDDFLGCSQWPRCDYTESLPMDILMRRQGAEQLPGFE